MCLKQCQTSKDDEIYVYMWRMVQVGTMCRDRQTGRTQHVQRLLGMIPISTLREEYFPQQLQYIDMYV